MAELLTDEWFEQVLAAGGELSEHAGVSFTFTIEVSESPLGKVRGHGEIVDGRIAGFASGKPASPADVALSIKNKRLSPILDGSQHPLVAFMLGELKVEGAYELVVDDFASHVDRAEFEAFRVAVEALTA